MAYLLKLSIFCSDTVNYTKNYIGVYLFVGANFSRFFVAIFFLSPHNVAMLTTFDYVSARLDIRFKKKHGSLLANAIWNRVGEPLIPFRTDQFLLTESGYQLVDLYFPSLRYGVMLLDEDYEAPTPKDLAPIDAVYGCAYIFANPREITLKTIQGPRENKPFDIKSFFAQVDSIAQEIQSLYAASSKKVLEFDETAHRIQMKQEKQVVRGDEFLSLAEVVSCFDEVTPSFFRSSYWLRKGMIWSPSLSLHGSARDGCLVSVSSDLNTVEELADRNPERARELFNAEKENNTPRYLFLRCHDLTLLSPRVFLGAYQADSYNQDSNTVVWKLFSTRLSYEENKLDAPLTF